MKEHGEVKEQSLFAKEEQQYDDEACPPDGSLPDPKDGRKEDGRKEGVRPVELGRRAVNAANIATPRPVRPPKLKCTNCGKKGHKRSDCDSLIV